jgi:hypothetical protein
MTSNVYRDGKVHVLSEKCPTCVFRPGNLMDLDPGRLAGMVKEATAAQTAIICHSTLPYHPKGGDEQAVCRGFFDRHPTQPLQIAERLDMIAWVDL